MTHPTSLHANALQPGRRGKRAFTLIELMIVVAIVGILAVLAVVGYRKLILGAHTSEATHMVQSIRVAQEAYHAEAQTYVSTDTADCLTDLYPVGAGTGPTKWAWTTPTVACAAMGNHNCFALLPVHSDGPVAYGYATCAIGAGNPAGAIAVPGVTGGVAGPAGNMTTDFYWITATGNVANYTSAAQYSYVVGNSATNDLYIQDQ